jgi:hypothetical protein
VDPLPGRYRDDAEGAARLQVVDAPRHRKALGDDDLAGDVGVAMRRGEEVMDALRMP